MFNELPKAVTRKCCPGQIIQFTGIRAWPDRLENSVTRRNDGVKQFPLCRIHWTYVIRSGNIGPIAVGIAMAAKDDQISLAQLPRARPRIWTGSLSRIRARHAIGEPVTALNIFVVAEARAQSHTECRCGFRLRNAAA